MTHTPKLIDPLDVEQDEAELTAELFAAFEPYRDSKGDPSDLKRRTTRGQENPEMSPWDVLMKAASLVPAGLLPKGLLKVGGATAVSATGAAGGVAWGALSTLAFPSVILVMIGMALWSAIRGSIGGLPQRGPTDESHIFSSVEALKWLRGNLIWIVAWAVALPVVFLLALSANHERTMDVVLLLFTLSSVSLVLALQRVVRLRCLTRRHVAQVTLVVAIPLAFLMPTLAVVVRAAEPSQLFVANRALPPRENVMICMMIFWVVMPLAGWIAHSRDVRARRIHRWSFALQIALLSILMIRGAYSWKTLTLVTPEDVVAWVEQGDHENLRPLDFEGMADTVAHLRASGYEVNTARLEQAVMKSFERGLEPIDVSVPGGSKRALHRMHTGCFAGMFKLGLMTDGMRDAWLAMITVPRDRPDAERIAWHRQHLLEKESGFSANDAITLRFVEGEHSLVGDERARLAELLERSAVPGEKWYMSSITRLALCAQVLGELGETERAAAVWSDLARNLEGWWIRLPDGTAGFTMVLERDNGERRRTDLDSTSDAVRVLAMAGTDGGLDIDALDAYLAAAARWTGNDLSRANAHLAAATRARLHAAFGLELPPFDVLGWIRRFRFTLASLVMSCALLIALVRAPRG